MRGYNANQAPAHAARHSPRYGAGPGNQQRHSMVSRKTATVGGQGEKQSKVVEQFAKGFVARTDTTDAEREAQRTWNRDALLQVNEDDAQVNIFNAYAKKIISN